MSTRRSPERLAASLTLPRTKAIDVASWGQRWLVGLVMVAHCALAGATELAATAEINRIGRERGAVERDSKAAQAACAERFAVNACIERVKAERRERLQQLDRERAAIDDERRKQRAAERAAELVQRKADRTTPSPGKAARVAKQSASAPEPGRPRRSDSPKREAAAMEVEALAARRAEASTRRATQAQAHREEVERRNRVNAASKAPSKPLPVLPAASAVP